MESVSEIGLTLRDYEKDFLLFQKNLPELKMREPNKFVAFKNGSLVTSGLSVEEVSKKLIIKGIEPSGTVIEFVPKEEIRMIV